MRAAKNGTKEAEAEQKAVFPALVLLPFKTFKHSNFKLKKK